MASDPTAAARSKPDADAKEAKGSLPSLLRAPVPHQLYINGGWRAAASDASQFALIDPATEAELTRVPNATAADVDVAVKAARSAFDSGAWSGLTGRQRGAYMRAIAAKVIEHKERLATIEAWTSGKPWREADWDMGDVAGCFEYFAGLAEARDDKKDQEVTLPDADYSAVVRLEPVGVVGAIVPWNYPLLMATWKLAPALATGCTIVLKPSELTPLTTLELCNFCTEVGLPAGVLNIVTGVGEITGNAIINHPLIDKLAFTGSVPTGVRIMSAAAAQVKRVSLELGGKSAAIVFDDVDIEKTVEWIMFGCFWTNGQICSATSRLLLHERIADAFIARLVAAAKTIPVGAPLDPELKSKTGALGPLVNRRQYDNVVSFVNGAIADKANATLLTGGKRPASQPRGFFLEPTIFRVKPEAKIWTTEIFGPVLSILTFKDEAEGLRLANDTEFGLAGAVFSADAARCQRVVRGLRVGITWINCSQPTFSQLPWGGVKKSGFGRDLGEAGFAAYLELKQVVTYVPGPAKALGWYDMAASSSKA